MSVHRVVPDFSSDSLEAATAFYGDVLGLQPVMNHGWIVTLADPERPQVQLSLMTQLRLSFPMRLSRWTTWTPVTQRPSEPARRSSIR